VRVCASAVARQKAEANVQETVARGMDDDVVRQVKQNPAYAELVAKRNRFGWTLAIVMLVIYYGFILLVAFAKSFLETDIGSGVTLAFPIGLAVIVAAVVITGLYVIRANGEFDELTYKIEKAVR
jgi:uncharacterized membrane protein (DUF485 family)